MTAHQQSRALEVVFASGETLHIPYELMRVYSPSAEVRGHGPGQEVLQAGKREVGLFQIEPVGHYAVKPTFSDGHDSGIFTWEYLHFLGTNQTDLWQQYQRRLDEAGLTREASSPPITPTPSNCRSH